MKNQKLWGGRFQQETSALMDNFNASIGFDYQLYPYDIEGSIAHATMLAKCKIITQNEKAKIIGGLKKILDEIESGKFKWQVGREDVHLNIEARLIELIGPVGGKLHSARSRNDQVALDMRLYCRDQCAAIKILLENFQKALVQQAQKNVDTLLPGYTHLQRAQPIRLAHYLLAYVEMAERDVGRIQDCATRLNVLPLGSGALAGTSLPIDREYVAELLNFSRVSQNSLDAVSDRDHFIELLSALSMIIMHLSRLSEEWILWATQEFSFIELPQEYCTGSSMMPQKINPDVLELIRGKTGRIYGALMSLLTIMKGTPLAYNKDFQEDKEPLFDAVSTIKNSLQILTELIAKTKFKQDKMLAANQEGFVLATEVADYLVRKGVPFREAHRIVGIVIHSCQKSGKYLENISLTELKEIHPSFANDYFTEITLQQGVDRKNITGGTAKQQVLKQIKRWGKKLG